MYGIHVIEELEIMADFKLSHCFVLQTSCKLLLWKGIARVCPSQQETFTINPGGISHTLWRQSSNYRSDRVPDIVGISTSTCSGPARNISAAVSETISPGKTMEFSKTAGAKVLVIVGSRSVSPFDGTYWEDVMQHMVQISESPAKSLFFASTCVSMLHIFFTSSASLSNLS